MSEINVATTFATGTTIHMDAVETLNFIELTAITVIRMSDEIENNYNSDMHIFESKCPSIDAWIESYTSGVHGAILINMYCNYVDILHRFVQDIVLNESVRGLYLMRRENKLNFTVGDLICLALEIAQLFSERRAEIAGVRCTTNFTDYNKQFNEMMKGE